MRVYRGMGSYVKECRENSNMSVEELASKIGIPQKHLDEIEKDIRPLTFGLIKQLYKFLEFDPLIIGAPLNSSEFSKLISTDSIKWTEDISGRIRTIREKIGFNQKDFAHLLDTNQRTVSHWENGRNDPSVENIVNIVFTFQVDPYWLFFGEDDELIDFLKARSKDYSSSSSKNSLQAEICSLLDNASEKFLLNLRSKLLKLQQINDSY